MRKLAPLLPVLIVLVLSPFCADAQMVKSLFGKKTIAGGEKYKSPNHVFTILLPQPTDFERMPYSIREYVKKGAYETVVFNIFDFGEMYSAGVLLDSAQPDLGAVADNAAITREHQRANPLRSIEESRVATQFGEALLRVYLAKDGSLLKVGDLTHQEFVDSYIAVIVVRQGTRTYYAASQDDYIGDGGEYPAEQWKQKLKDGVQRFFATMATN